MSIDADRQPDAPRMALPPTTALRIIRAVLGDSGLTMAQQKTTCAVILQADSATGRAWASYRQLGGDYGLAPASIAGALRADDQDALGAAIGKYLRPVRRGGRGAILYQVLTEAIEAASASPDEAPQDASASTNEARATASQAEARFIPQGSALQPVKRSASPGEAILTPILAPDSQEPPNPPQAGGGEREVAALKEPQSEDEAVALAEAAHRAVFATGLPWAFKRKVRREFKGGDRAALAALDEAAIRGGAKLARDAGKTFGFGWVMRFIGDRAAAVKAAGRQKQQADAAAQDQQRRRADEDRRRADEAAARMEHFADLPDARKDEYRRKAGGERFAPKRADLLDALAAALAWRDRAEAATS